jgi:hypothetical protein
LYSIKIALIFMGILAGSSYSIVKLRKCAPVNFMLSSSGRDIWFVLHMKLYECSFNLIHFSSDLVKFWWRIITLEVVVVALGWCAQPGGRAQGGENFYCQCGSELASEPRISSHNTYVAYIKVAMQALSVSSPAE